MFSQVLKTRTYWIKFVSVLGVLLLLGASTVQADTEVGGPIISDTTWTAANSPYIVVESVDVQEGVTLTIEPGVTVKFDAEKKLQVNGELIAQGTDGSPITFTSNQADPAPGDWGNIEFTETAITTTMDAEGNYINGSILQYCVVEYGGTNVDWDSATIDVHSLLIDHCQVRENDTRGILNEGTETSRSRITNSTVVSNTTCAKDGAGICATWSVIEGNTVKHNVAGEGSQPCFAHGGGIYAKRSTISSNSVSNNISDKYGDGICAVENSTVNGNTVNGNSGGWYSIYVSDGEVSSNTVANNDPYYGSIAAEGSKVNGNTVIENAVGIVVEDSEVRNNTISKNERTGVYAERSTVSHNVVSGNDVRGIRAADSTVQSNTITDNEEGLFATDSKILTNTINANKSYGVGISGGEFRYNTVVANGEPPTTGSYGVWIDGTPQVHYNNLYGNESYDVWVASSSDVSGTHNYWGTVSSVDILDQVYDWHDDSSRGKFLYVPYLQEPSEDAPFPPPTGLTLDAQEQTIALSWNAHPSFTTGWGYKVYYDTDSSLPPYEGTGLNEGDAPIDVGDQTTYTLTGLDPSKDYYVAVTAYDNEGHESWYSNLEQKRGGYWVYLPAVLRQ